MSLFLALADILFVGDGRMDRDVARLVEAGLREMGGSVSVAVDTIGGAPLEYNFDHPSYLDPKRNPPDVEALSELQKGETRALVLSEGLPLPTIVAWHEPVDAVSNYAAVARAANPDVRVFYTERWHSLQSGIDVKLDEDAASDVPWRDRIDLDRDIWRAIAAKASDDPLSGGRIEMIPVGQAMGRLADEIEAGKVSGISDIREIFRDDVATNGRGSYFVAMVHLAAMTGQSPEGLPSRILRAWPSRDWVLSDEQAAIFQRIAWEEVVEFAGLPPLKFSEPATTGDMAVAASAAIEPFLPPGPVPDVIDLPGVSNPDLFVGLAGVADWSVQVPFLDLMKTSRQWFGHLPGEWGGRSFDDLARAGVFDEHGWPTSVPQDVTALSTLVLTDLPADSKGVRGRYVLRYEGQGSLKVEGIVRQVAAEQGRIIFDYEPGAGFAMVTLEAMDPADPIHNITIVREDRVAALDAGEMFNPDWLARLRGVQGVRFKDWMATNNSAQSRWDDRPMPDDVTWTAKGVPLEVMIALANELDADPWFTMPHLADDDYVRNFAQMVRNGLEPELQVWAELSNEVWNWQFAQASWAEEQGEKRWGQESAWVQFYALRASEMAAIWTDVYGADAKTRLVRVISSQTGYQGLETQILSAPLVMGEGRPAPALNFDAYAVTGYFSGQLGQDSKVAAVRDWIDQSRVAAEQAASDQGLTGDAADSYVAAHRFDTAIKMAAVELRDGSLTGDTEDSLVWNIDNVLPYHAQVARQHGLKLVMYEGGTHVVGLGDAVDDPLLTEFFSALNYSPEMGAMYTDLLKAWSGVSDAPFTHYVEMGSPSKWGSWGAMRHLGDVNPRWDALATGCDDC